jgi:hypothetical protein
MRVKVVRDASFIESPANRQWSSRSVRSIPGQKVHYEGAEWEMMMMMRGSK